jgi:hypothetical protein
VHRPAVLRPAECTTPTLVARIGSNGLMSANLRCVAAGVSGWRLLHLQRMMRPLCVRARDGTSKTSM